MSDAPSFDFGNEVYSGETSSIEVDGFTVTATIHHDDSRGAPWENEDGHGPVSDWRKRDYAGRYQKAPGERALISDRHGARFYDFAEACKVALRDGWGAAGDEGMTPRQKAAHAANADFERLRKWCADQWYYVGVSITVERAGVELVGPYDFALWGIESDCGEHCSEVAEELMGEALDAARAKISQLAESLA